MAQKLLSIISTSAVPTCLPWDNGFNWGQVEKLHYPMAGDMVKSLKSQMESQQAAQTMPQTVPAGADVLAGLTGGGEGV